MPNISNRSILVLHAATCCVALPVNIRSVHTRYAHVTRVSIRSVHVDQDQDTEEPVKKHKRVCFVALALAC